MDSTHFSTMTIVFMLVLFFVLLFVSAFFSLTETALFSINKVRLDFLIKQKNQKAISIFNNINEPDKLLSTLLTGNNIVNTSVSTIGTTLALYYLHAWGVILAPLIVAFILLLFSETFPKVLATQFPETLSLWIIKPYEWVRWILSPIVSLIMYLTYLFFNLFGVKIEYKKTIFNREEVKHIIRESGETGTLAGDEHKMLHRVFEFNDKLTREIMVPVQKIVSINAGMHPDDIIRVVTEAGFTRYPVYQDHFDNVIGFIHAKTLINLMVNNPLFILEDLMLEPYFVTEEEKISEVLKEFQQKGLHIAVVKNDKGIVTGIIQIKDILKVIFGELTERPLPETT
ncbi:MAG: hemolysin family protein [Planctomycetota bacterium]